MNRSNRWSVIRFGKAPWKAKCETDAAKAVKLIMICLANTVGFVRRLFPQPPFYFPAHPYILPATGRSAAFFIFPSISLPVAPKAAVQALRCSSWTSVFFSERNEYIIFLICFYIRQRVISTRLNYWKSRKPIQKKVGIHPKINFYDQWPHCTNHHRPGRWLFYRWHQQCPEITGFRSFWITGNPLQLYFPYS